jgi:hypothetical protein
MIKNYYQPEDDDETELPDLSSLAKQNSFGADEEANLGANHMSNDLPEDNSITYQDPSARLGRELA